MQKYEPFYPQVRFRKGNLSCRFRAFQRSTRLAFQCHNNINQIAKRVNSTGVIYKDYIQDMKKEIEYFSKELWQIHSLLMKRTSETEGE